jgi:hypothetical protein
VKQAVILNPSNASSFNMATRASIYHHISTLQSLAYAIQVSDREDIVKKSFFSKKLGFESCQDANGFLMHLVNDSSSNARLCALQNLFILGTSDENGAFGYLPSPYQFSVLEHIATATSKDYVIFKMVTSEMMHYLSFVDGESQPMHNFSEDLDPHDEENRADDWDEYHDVQHLAIFMIDRADQMAYIVLDLESYHDDTPREMASVISIPPPLTGHFSPDYEAARRQHQDRKSVWNRVDAEKGLKRFKYRPTNNLCWQKGWSEDEALLREANRILSTPDDSVMLIAHDLNAYPLPRQHMPKSQYVYSDGANFAGARDWFERKGGRGIGQFQYQLGRFSVPAVYSQR